MKKFKDISEFEKLVKTQLENHSTPPPSKVWDNIDFSSLNQSATKGSKIIELIKINIDFPVFPSFNFTENKVDLMESEGNIIMPGSFFTDLSVIIGSFNYFNFNCFIAHDVSIESFNTFSPFVKISGNCKIKSNNFLGTGCILFPKVSIDNSSIGAGAVVKIKVITNKIIDIPKSIIYEKR